MPIIEIFDDSLSPLMALKKQREYNPISWKERLQAEPVCLPVHANPVFVKINSCGTAFLIQVDHLAFQLPNRNFWHVPSAS